MLTQLQSVTLHVVLIKKVPLLENSLIASGSKNYTGDRI